MNANKERIVWAVVGLLMLTVALNFDWRATCIMFVLAWIENALRRRWAKASDKGDSGNG